jgi:hypothetical protein
MSRDVDRELSSLTSPEQRVHDCDSSSSRNDLTWGMKLTTTNHHACQQLFVMIEWSLLAGLNTKVGACNRWKERQEALPSTPEFQKHRSIFYSLFLSSI